MQIQVVKSKIHRVKVTGAELNYIGSITIDEDLMDAANIIRGEKVQIVNNNNGERLETYAIPGPRKSGEITLNGAAARKVAKGDFDNLGDTSTLADPNVVTSLIDNKMSL